jgi:hypothetical protein
MSAPIAVIALAGAAILPLTSSISNPLLAAVPVDMWTIGVADRLRFPHFPSKLGARLRPHTHRRHSNKEFEIDEVRGKAAAPANAMTAIRARIKTGKATS